MSQQTPMAGRGGSASGSPRCRPKMHSRYVWADWTWPGRERELGKLRQDGA